MFFSTPLPWVSASHPNHLTLYRSQLNVSHRRLVLGFEVTVQGDVLVDRKCLPAGVSGDQLKFGISQAKK